jgi:inner membrane protein
MFVAHIPAGYLLSRYLSTGHADRKALILTGIVASVLPDTDLLSCGCRSHLQGISES